MGKGDGRRPTAIAEQTFARNWCRTWGHKMRDTHEVCINCGITAKEIVEDESQGLVQTRRRRRKSAPSTDAE
jgi:hypothetical protein